MQVSEMNYTQPYEITNAQFIPMILKLLLYSSAKDKNIIDKISFFKITF